MNQRLIKIIIIVLVLACVAIVLVGCDDKDYEELNSSQGIIYNLNTGKVDKLLTYEELYPIVVEAKVRWRRIISEKHFVKLDKLKFVIVRFKNNVIGRHLGNQQTILIDGYADWFVDKTPKDDKEFKIYRTTNLLIAKVGRGAINKLDLLSLVMHEMGHALGLDDIEEAVQISYIDGSSHLLLMHHVAFRNTRINPNIREWKEETE